jgi:tetratricopeptide (TPR) repeat protein
VLSTLGVAYDYEGGYADARDAYAQALIASPSNPTVLNNLALSQAASGDLDGAIATLQQAIDQPAALAQTRQNLALLLALKGDPDGAERLARKDLPPEIADGNISYFRMISAAATKGGAMAPASITMPAATSSISAAEPIEPATVPAASAEPAATATIEPILPMPSTAPLPSVAPVIVPAPQSNAAPQAPTTPQNNASPQDGEAVR